MYFTVEGCRGGNGPDELALAGYAIEAPRGTGSLVASAAVDDSIAVWKELIKTHTPRNIGIFGTSAGGGLTLAIVMRLKELGLPLPGAIMAGTPWADLSETGDSYFTNQFVDNVLCTSNGVLEAAGKLYAGSHDLKEPLVSPVFGDLSGFPPTVLLSGTRDQF